MDMFHVHAWKLMSSYVQRTWCILCICGIKIWVYCTLYLKFSNSIFIIPYSYVNCQMTSKIQKMEAVQWTQIFLLVCWELKDVKKTVNGFHMIFNHPPSLVVYPSKELVEILGLVILFVLVFKKKIEPEFKFLLKFYNDAVIVLIALWRLMGAWHYNNKFREYLKVVCLWDYSMRKFNFASFSTL